MTTKLDAPAVLDRCLLEMRHRILDLAAHLDRIERAAGAEGAKRDPRFGQLREAIGVLVDARADRAERVQMVFSLPYEEGWKR